MVEFRMPSLGADMEAGTLVEWLVKRGQQVKRGDIVAVVETQKGAIEIEIFETGTIEDILVEPGAKVPVGKPLARILTDEEAKRGKVPELAREPVVPLRAPVLPTVSPPTPIAVPTPRAAEVAHRLPASPAARRLAQTTGLDLAEIKGTGPSGAITRADGPKRPLMRCRFDGERAHFYLLRIEVAQGFSRQIPAGFAAWKKAVFALMTVVHLRGCHAEPNENKRTDRE